MVLFFFKQKTAYEMRISDWSSDVCSSDLISLQGSQLFAHFLPQACIQRGQRLVQQQQPGFYRQRTRQCRPLLLATRDFARVALQDAFQFKRTHPTLGRNGQLMLSGIEQALLQAKADVLLDRQVREQAVTLL